MLLFRMFSSIQEEARHLAPHLALARKAAPKGGPGPGHPNMPFRTARPADPVLEGTVTAKAKAAVATTRAARPPVPVPSSATVAGLVALPVVVVEEGRVEVPAAEVVIAGELGREAGGLLGRIAPRPAPSTAVVEALHPARASLAYAKEVPRVAAQACDVPSGPMPSADVVPLPDARVLAGPWVRLAWRATIEGRVVAGAGAVITARPITAIAAGVGPLARTRLPTGVDVGARPGPGVAAVREGIAGVAGPAGGDAGPIHEASAARPEAEEVPPGRPVTEEVAAGRDASGVGEANVRERVASGPSAYP